MNDKIVKVIFKEGWETMYNNDLTQGDFGQVLQIEGITLPDENVEVHFSLTEHNGEAPISIGTVKDNTITVDIPDFILAKENTYNSSYEAYAWIYVTDGESGRTIRKIAFTVDTRATPTTNVPEDQKDQFLQEVRQVLTETKEVADSVRTDADNGKFNGKDGDKGDTGKSAYEYAVDGGYTGTEAEFMEGLARAGDVITKEEHEAELLKAMVKVTTEESAFHHITDSANMKVVDFGMRGITEQETTEGKNYYSGGDVSGTTNMSNLSQNIQPIPAGAYTFSANVKSSDTDSTYCFIIFYYEDGTNISASINRGARQSCLITFTQPVKYFRCYAAASNVLGEGDTFSFTDIQIEPGEVATDYEPYTNGPSPNLTYSQEIELAGVYNEETGRYEHKCCVGNKNFFDKESAEAFYRSNTVINYKGYPIFVGKGNTITISILNKLNTGLGFYLLFTEKESNKNNQIGSWLYHSGSESLISQSIKLISECDYIWLKIAGNWGGAIKYVFDTLQIEISDTATELLPHASQPLTLTSDRPLTMWDNLVKVDGKWYWDYAGKEYEVTGKELWKTPEDIQNYLTGTSSNMFWTCEEKVRDTYNIKNGFVDRLSFVDQIWSKSDGTEGFDFNYQQIHLRIRNSILSVSDDATNDEKTAAFVAYLQAQYDAGTPVKIYYELAEHELVPLLDEEQELLHNLETYYGVTNVYNEQGCPIWIKYVADQELHWNQKLLQIQQAII